MAKQVFANGNVAHVWAQRDQESGRSHNGNYSFEGDKLYSYSTCIAKFVRTEGGETVALVTSQVYSKTTSSKHMPPIWRALGRDVRTFRVPNVSPILRGEGGDHSANLAHLVAEYEKEAKRMRNPRVSLYNWGNDKTDAEVMADNLNRVWAPAMDYAEAFGLTAPALPATFSDVRTLAESLAATRHAYLVAASTPEAVAKREADAEKRRDAKERKEREARRVAMLAEADKRAEWLAGNRAVRFYGRDETGGAFIRATGVTRDAGGAITGGTLETSQGATVPLVHAIKAFRFVKTIAGTDKVWRRNGRTIRVGHFQIDCIDSDGFNAGCHRINWPEIARLAKSLDVFDAAPSDSAVELSH